MLKHKEGLFFDIPPLASGFHASIQKQTNGTKSWHHYWGFPRFEGVFGLMNFGNNEVLGTALSLAPGFRFTLKKWNKTGLYLHYATGIAYLSKKFNPINNPSNNAIGSNYNNMSRLKLGFERVLTRDLNLLLGFSFNHFSNGLTRSPNSGINTYGLNLGISSTFGNKIEISEKPVFRKHRKFGLSTMLGIGVSEHSNYGGPNFPIYIAGLGGYWRHASFQRLHFGFEYEYSTKVYEFELSIFTDEEIARRRSRRTIIYVAEELMFGDISMRFQLGFYTQVASEYTGTPFYIKVMTLYHPPIKATGEFKPYLGMILKTHFAVAEYIGIATGVTF